MRIYVSSTFEDLREYRAAAIQVLRQLGHEVVAMEDYVAESSVPLARVLEDVASCDVLVEIVAWRYGYVPQEGLPGGGGVPGAVPKKTSITEYEYRKAVEQGKTVLAFLLDERAPWPAHLIDSVRDPHKGAAIRTFRTELQRTRMVAYFATPDALASRVAAAVGAVGMRAEIRRQIVAPYSAAMLASFTFQAYLNDSHTMPVVELVSQPTPALAAAIDISTTWWSTRLYLLAAIGQTLGDLRRIVVLDRVQDKVRFAGMLSASAVRSVTRRIHPQADSFEKGVLSQTATQDVRQTARRYLEQEWNAILGANPGDSGPEQSIALTVNAPNLRLWFGDALLETPLHIDDLESATAVDLLRILDYPNDFVPVVSERVSTEYSVQLVNKKELTERLARNTIVEMLDRIGVR
jgi:hypothetical protein